MCRSPRLRRRYPQAPSAPTSGRSVHTHQLRRLFATTGTTAAPSGGREMPEIVRKQPWAARGPHVAPDGTTRRPPGMVVSMWLLHRLEPNLPGLQLTDGLDQMRQRPTQPVQPPHHQRLPRPQLTSRRPSARPLATRRSAPRGHPRVTQKFAHDHALLHNPPTSVPMTHRFRTVLLQHPAVPLTCRPLFAVACCFNDRLRDIGEGLVSMCGWR